MFSLDAHQGGAVALPQDFKSSGRGTCLNGHSYSDSGPSGERLIGPHTAKNQEKQLQNGLGFQRVDFLKYGLKSLLQLLLGSRLSFCSCELPVISNGAPVKIGSFYQ
jgi:hypothetical protein